jgi:hypothetical protein
LIKAVFGSSKANGNRKQKAMLLLPSTAATRNLMDLSEHVFVEPPPLCEDYLVLPVGVLVGWEPFSHSTNLLAVSMTLSNSPAQTPNQMAALRVKGF